MINILHDFFRRQRVLSIFLCSVLVALIVGKVAAPQISRALSQLGTLNQQSTPNAAVPSNTPDLASEMDYFFDQIHAVAYLVWQFSGDKSNPLGNDKYSFFRNTPDGDRVCGILKSEADKHPDKLVGVNMHDLPEHVDQAESLLSYLSSSCGVKIIRVFATAGTDTQINAVKTILDTAQNHGIKVIVVASDYSNQIGPSNPNPTVWYQSKNVSEGYQTYIEKLANQIGGNPALFNIELSNEPHCSGVTGCVSAYINWAAQSAAAIKQTNSAAKVSIGQMGSHNNTLGDSPGDNSYGRSNSSENLDYASGHYYNPDEKATVVKAATEKRPDQAFYIGEAPATLNGATSTQKIPAYFEYNIQRADNGKVLNNLLDEYSASCMPKEEYQVLADNQDKCQQLGVCNNWNVSGSLNISANDKMFGLFRSEKQVDQRNSNGQSQAPTSRFESLETYLSARAPQSNSSSSDSPAISVTAPTLQDISPFNAPIYKLTTLEQQCGFVMDKLKAVDTLCSQNNRIEGENDGKTACAIDTKIPGYSITHLQLLSEMQNSGLSCKEIMQTDSVLRREVMATPLSMEMAYRPAFIVAVTNFDGDTVRKTTDQNVTSTTSKPDSVTGRFITVNYMEVKVPAFGSDFLADYKDAQGPEGPNTQKDEAYATQNTYRDPLLLTADALRTEQQKTTIMNQEKSDRAALREQAVSDGVMDQSGNVVNLTEPRGRVIGANGENIFCYDDDGKLKQCGKTDNQLPSALVAFINANNAIANSPGHVGPSVPCQPNEIDFYPDKTKKKISDEIAEQAAQIGTELLPNDQTGKYKKRTDLNVNVSFNVKDVSRQLEATGTHTELYFISPHNYNLQYVQQSFLAFLTQDQQGKLAEMGLTDSTGGLSPDAFSPLLKTDINEKFSGGQESRPQYENTEKLTNKADAARSNPQSGDTNNSAHTNTSNDQTQTPKPQVSVELGQPQADDGSGAKNHPLFWQFAGQVASLPTRLMALVTTTKDSMLSQYTLSCTGDHATENWLLGNCQSKQTPPPTAPSCKPDTTITACKNLNSSCVQCKDPSNCDTAAITGTGQQAKISDTTIALALQVSKYTCTPAEVLIGVLAKESSGSTFHAMNGQDEQPDTGDPNELIFRQDYCRNLNFSNVKDPHYNYGCGAYQFAQSDLTGYPGLENGSGQLSLYNNAIQECLDNLQVTMPDGTVEKLDASDKDNRKLGISMCVASAKIWRSTYCNNIGGCNFPLGSNKYGCGDDPNTVQHAIAEKAYSLDELNNLGFTDHNFQYGIEQGFHGADDGTTERYWSFVQEYRSAVERVRNQLASCSMK